MGVRPVPEATKQQVPMAYSTTCAVLSSHRTFPVAVVPPPRPPSHSAPGSQELPSIGSAGHEMGRCKPCAFLHTRGCANGIACPFCHLCDADEKKRRRKEKVQSIRAVRKVRSEARRARA